MPDINNELGLQKKIVLFLSEPSKVYYTKSGKRLQVLSPGKLSTEGPDLKDITILLNGYLIIGDAEIHLKSSDWIKHRHESDENYKNTILHITLNDDFDLKGKFETLIIDKKELVNINYEQTNSNDSIIEIEELQNYALIRLLRKTSEAKIILEKKSYLDTLTILSQNFISKYEARRHRPKYNSKNLSEILDAIYFSNITSFLKDIFENKEIQIPDIMQKLIKTKISNEGPHLRRELILNAVLPIAIAMANDENRINLFAWFWATPALNSYGILTRRFPNLPQNYIWQQQGMLEYIKQKSILNNLIAESFRQFGFFEVLNFYKYGRLPLDFYEEEV